MTQVGLLYDYRGTRQPGRGNDMPQAPALKPTPIHEVCLELARAQLHRDEVAGSEPFDFELRAADLERYPVMVVNEPLMVEGAQRGLLDEWEQKGRVVRWRGIERKTYWRGSSRKCRRASEGSGCGCCRG